MIFKYDITYYIKYIIHFFFLFKKFEHYLLYFSYTESSWKCVLEGSGFGIHVHVCGLA